MIKPQKAIYIPNGVDYRGIADSKPRFEDARFRILYLGRLVREKNLETLIRAYKEAKSDVSEMQLMIVGDGPERRKLRKFAHRTSTKDILWIGGLPHEEVGSYYKSASVFVLPSPNECSPISIVEAQASGVPVIISDTVNLKIKMKENGVALVFRKGDERDLAKKILTIYNGGDTKKELILRGKNYAKRFDWNAIVDRIIMLYLSMF